jgi:diguanylate cyclase (GGDEF)-like protein/hemerythrin-like metal-binding protein/PAS domain S-box-containing protein
MQNIDIFPWDNHFNTGIEVIDNQHRKLVIILNRLATMVAYQSTNDELNNILDELIEYTVYHFQTEEAIWDKHIGEDPAKDEHETVHQKFIDTVVELKKQQDIKPLNELADDALKFLAKWLASHILENDRYMSHIVVALEEGLTIHDAKERAKEKMSGSSKIFVEIILSIYSTLSENTLHLMREIKSHTLDENKIVFQDKYRELLLELSTSFINLPIEQIDDAIEEALGKISSFVGADRAYIFEYDFINQTSSNTYEWCGKGIQAQIDQSQNIPIDSMEDWFEVHSKGEQLFIQDVFALPQGTMRDILVSQDIKSLVTLPLMEKNVCKGFVGFNAVKQQHSFTEVETALLNLFSELLVNVSQRKNAQETLSHERSFLKTLIQAIPDLVWLKDTNGIYLFCNQRFEDFFGAKESDIVGKSDYDFVEESLADFFREHDKQVMQSGKVNINEEELPFASDGHKEIIHTTKVPIYDKNKNLIGVLGVGRDITQFKCAQKELETKEHYQRALLDNFPFLVWLKDNEGSFLAVNQPFADACSISSTDDLVGKNDLDIWPKELAKAYRADDAEVIASGKLKNVEELLESNDKQSWIETYKSPVTIDGNVIGSVGFSRDITEKKELEKDLIMERDRFERYLQTVEAIIISMDESGKILLINQKGCDLLEYTEEELIGQQWFKICLPQPAGIEEVYPVFLDIMSGDMQGAEYFENIVKTKSGKEYLIAWNNTYLKDDQGSIIGTLSAGENITKRRKDEESLNLAASVFSHSREGIIITSSDNKILNINSSVERITGYSKEDLLGRNPKILSSGKYSKSFYTDMWQAINTQGHWSGEVSNRHKNGSVYIELLTISAVKDSKNNILNYIALFSDITSTKEQQKRLEYIAHYDALTGLPNRVLFSDRLHQAMSQTRRNKSMLAVVYIDLDGFKEINDVYGHDHGDILLSTISARMREVTRDGDTVARIGGDEFVAVLLGLQEQQECIPMLSRLLRTSSEAVHHNDLVMNVSASIGVSFFAYDDNIDADQLIRYADQAMYQAKILGKNRFHIFDSIEDASIRTYHEKIENIKNALYNNEFVLYYQPKLNMKTGETVGLEALIRWMHPVYGVIHPEEFLPVVDGNDLSIEIGEWVLEEAIRHIEQWKNLGFNFVVSINISAIHLLQGNLLGHIKMLLFKYPKVNTTDFKLEILETSALEDITHVVQVMEDCNKLGILFSLDDFGTGYSSLTYLKRLPASELKIDRSFVWDMLHDTDDLIILNGIINLANTFQRDVIAEGVESIEQGVLLLRMGCEVAQGYVIAKPMPMNKIIKWVKEFKVNEKWVNCQAMNRDEISVLYALVEHNAWMNKFEYYIQGKNSQIPQQDHTQCKLNEWLSCIRKSSVIESFKLDRLETLHKELHKKANMVIKSKSDNLNHFNNDIEEVKKIHREIIDILI